MQDKFNPSSLEDFPEDEDSFYERIQQDRLVEDDELEPWEAAWMQGYNSAE